MRNWSGSPWQARQKTSQAAWARQLYVLYVYAADHGTGAGRALLEAVIAPAESAVLWVADPDPRAQAFYRKHGFVPDGTAQIEDGVREIRMVRDVRHSAAMDSARPLGSLVLAGAPAALRAAAARARGGGEDKGRWFALSGKISHR